MTRRPRAAARRASATTSRPGRSRAGRSRTSGPTPRNRRRAPAGTSRSRRPRRGRAGMSRSRNRRRGCAEPRSRLGRGRAGSRTTTTPRARAVPTLTATPRTPSPRRVRAATPTARSPAGAGTPSRGTPRPPVRRGGRAAPPPVRRRRPVRRCPASATHPRRPDHRRVPHRRVPLVRRRPSPQRSGRPSRYAEDEVAAPRARRDRGADVDRADSGRHSRSEFVDLAPPADPWRGTADPNYMEPDETPTLVDIASRRARKQAQQESARADEPGGSPGPEQGEGRCARRPAVLASAQGRGAMRELAGRFGPDGASA